VSALKGSWRAWLRLRVCFPDLANQGFRVYGRRGSPAASLFLARARSLPETQCRCHMQCGSGAIVTSIAAIRPHGKRVRHTCRSTCTHADELDQVLSSPGTGKQVHNLVTKLKPSGRSRRRQRLCTGAAEPRPSNSTLQLRLNNHNPSEHPFNSFIGTSAAACIKGPVIGATLTHRRSPADRTSVPAPPRPSPSHLR
jgi:hypothetical protein